MSGTQQEAVLAHIDDAASWLSRARNAYRVANRARAELDLCLAQAEVRYAWEISRGPRRISHPGIARDGGRWRLALAACLGLVLTASALAPFLLTRLDKPGGRGRTATAAGRAGARSAPRSLAPTVAKSQDEAAQPGRAQSEIQAGARDRRAPSPVVAVRNTGAAAAIGPKDRAAAPVAGGQPAPAEGRLMVDMGELAKLAQETLIKGDATAETQR